MKTVDEKKKIKADIEERIKILKHSTKQVGFNIVNCNMNASFAFDFLHQ
jgi:peroxiredoxin family protein